MRKSHEYFAVRREFDQLLMQLTVLGKREEFLPYWIQSLTAAVTKLGYPAPRLPTREERATARLLGEPLYPVVF